MGPPIQVDRPSYLAIHFASVFPATSVLCLSAASSTPATSEWRYVTRRRCLVTGSRTNAPALAALERRDAEREGQRRADEEGADAPFDLRRAGRLDDPAFAAHLAALDGERLRIGREIAARIAGGQGRRNALRTAPDELR